MAKRAARRAPAEGRSAFPRAFAPEPAGTGWEIEAGGRRVRLTNLDKVWWPEDGYTKGDLLAAYLNLADYILPHLRDRPLTLLRMPDGVAGESFYEKQAPSHTPDWVPRAHIEGHGRHGSTDFLLAQDPASLLFIANLGCIEMHPMHARAGRFDRPDYAFFDLDPFPPAGFDAVRRTALLVKVALERLGLAGYPKTSGATGMQIMVPLDGSHPYEEAREFVARVCRAILAAWPAGTTMEREISKRAGKVFLDHAMVSEARNIASVYSVRARPRAPVSTPLAWDEVEQDLEPEDFTIATIWERLARIGDLFAPVLDGGTPRGQNLAAAMDALGIARAEPAARARPAGGDDAAGARLGEYRRKRRFDATPEPPGAPQSEAARAAPLYLIHQHHARRLHFDLRLERDGVLASWAVPKGLPAEAGLRRLAVHVEDHPVEYGSFTGTIPQGEYGAGEVRIFDTGTYETVEWTDEKVTVRLHGARISGEYHLVRTDEPNWLVFRSSRDAPLPLPPAPPVLQPMLATGGGAAFDSPDWMFEPKWDGFRALAMIDRGSLRLLSRRGNDLTARFPELRGIAERLAAWNAILDGEIIRTDEQGQPSFELLQQRFGGAPAQGPPVDYIAFDLLWLDGESLVARPLEDRRALLERSLATGPHLQVSPQIAARGVAFFEAAKERGLEGVVAKRLGSIYSPGRRSPDWVKIKTRNRQDCVVIGWTPGRGARGDTVGALVLGVYRDSALEYAGHVGSGLSEAQLRALADRFAGLGTDSPPIAPPAEEADLGGVRWLRPEIVCEVEYAEMTSRGRMRAPSFKGLREDKVPEDCVLEHPAGP